MVNDARDYSLRLTNDSKNRASFLSPIPARVRQSWWLLGHRGEAIFREDIVGGYVRQECQN